MWGIEKYKYKKNERYLSEVELQRLGRVLKELEKTKELVFAVNAIRLLIFTGARKSEIIQARWQDVDFERGLLRLPDSKTGARFMNLGEAALDLLQNMPRMHSSPFIVPGQSLEKPLAGLQKIWERIRKKAGLEDVPLHSLRHSFGSFAASGNTSLYIIGKMLGHKDQATTQRYAHMNNDPVKIAVDNISSKIAKMLG